VFDVNIIMENKVISLPKEKFCNGKQLWGSFSRGWPKTYFLSLSLKVSLFNEKKSN